MENSPTPVRGAQLVSLTARVLKAMAEMSRGSCRMADIVERTGIERATVNRIVNALCAEAMAARSSDGRNYRLGPLTYELGLAAETRFPWREIVEPSLERIADETGDTCFFMIRSGQDAVCVARREGAYPVRALTIDVGNRRPLGAAAASLAILMHMPPDECDEYLAQNADRIRRHGMLTAEIVRDMVRRSRELGFSLNYNNILPEVSAVGVAIPARVGIPFAALSVAALTSRIMDKDRYKDIARLLKRESEAIADRLQHLS